MLLASNLCQALTQLVLVQRVCCARSDKTFHFSSRVQYYTDKKTCMKIFLSKLGFLYPQRWFYVSVYSLLLGVTKLVHYYSCLLCGKKNSTIIKNKIKYYQKKKAFHIQQLRKMTNNQITSRMFSFQNKGWGNKLWTEGGYWEMNFSVTPVTRKKETTTTVKVQNDNSWENMKKQTIRHKQKIRTINSKKNPKQIDPKNKKSQALFASYVPDSHK